MRWLIMLVVAGLWWAVAGAQDRPKGDQLRIQGTWQVLSDEESGRKAPAEAVKDLMWVITADKIKYTVGDKTTELAYKLDPSKKPKWLDFTTGNRTTLGIYDLEGDNLKICFPKRGKGKRSTEFESKPNSGNEILIILKREKP